MTFKPPPPPPGCLDSNEAERRLTSMADLLEAKARELLLESGGRLGVSAATNAALASVKARKLAADLAARREDEHRLEQLLDYEKKRLGIDGADRPRRRLERRS